MANSKKPPSGLFGRSSKLLSIAAKLASQQVGQSLRNTVSDAESAKSGILQTQISQAKVLTEGLASLRGAAMKAGQLLSMDASDWMPPEVREVLTQLQNQAQSMDFSDVNQILVSELGKEKYRQLKSLSEKPAASASIGQVHTAVVNGQKVAIKVQYPGIDKSIDSDLRILKTLAENFLRVSSKPIDLSELFKELAVVLKLEANYENEANNIDFFYQHLKNHELFVVPKVYQEFTSKHVLVMQWIEGMTLQEWLSSQPAEEEKYRVSEAMLKLYMTELLQWGFVQTDPNFANFLVQKDPFRLVLLDFGACLPYSLEFRKQYTSLMKTLESKDPNAILKSAFEFDLLKPNETEKGQKLFLKMMDLAIEPFLSEHQPFDFSNDDFVKRIREVSIEFTRSLKHSPPPRKVLFLHRKLGGIFNLMKQIGHKMDLAEYWQQMKDFDPSKADQAPFLDQETS